MARTRCSEKYSARWFHRRARSGGRCVGRGRRGWRRRACGFSGGWCPPLCRCSDRGGVRGSESRRVRSRATRGRPPASGRSSGECPHRAGRGRGGARREHFLRAACSGRARRGRGRRCRRRDRGRRGTAPRRDCARGKRGRPGVSDRAGGRCGCGSGRARRRRSAWNAFRCGAWPSRKCFSGRRTSRAGCAPRRPGCATSADPMAAGPRPGAGRRREGLGGRGANGATGGGGPWRGSTSEQRRRAKATMGPVGRRWPAANRDALPNGWRDRATRGAHAGAGRAAGWSGAAWPAIRRPTGRAFRLRGRPACRRL